MFILKIKKNKFKNKFYLLSYLYNQEFSKKSLPIFDPKYFKILLSELGDHIEGMDVWKIIDNDYSKWSKKKIKFDIDINENKIKNKYKPQLR
ncbi:hypothetical protein BpHYR1_038800 [Brachionus plicatilis]|uniref:Uncharacterized protein n=1 Tax=Brachionus plicatilis TaxID=10195 RepID=A0A3M7T5S8_BRAPC|nr:hypothetical protein BpHYR1_038800 [Brachionus plicatilis]